MQKTYKCPQCGAEVSRGKNTCPKCGARKKLGATDVVAWVIFGLALVLIAYFTLFMKR